MELIYFFIVLAATSVGALTGMGGGVFIKPILDMLGHFSPANIAVLSSATVLTMAAVSLTLQVCKKNYANYSLAIPLAIGSILGGFSGEQIFSYFVAGFSNKELITIVQNSVLMLMIAGIFLYMKNKEKIITKQITHKGLIILAGFFLGTISSFLGIGGGPINVVLLIYLFNCEAKMATLCSLITVLFSQIAKLGTIALSSGFSNFNLDYLPFMMISAVAGGLIGGDINRRISNSGVEKAFLGAQIIIFVICLVNISLAL